MPHHIILNQCCYYISLGIFVTKIVERILLYMYTVQIKTNKSVALWSSVCNWMVTEITTDNNLF